MKRNVSTAFAATMASWLTAIAALACPLPQISGNSCYVRDLDQSCCPADLGGLAISVMCDDGSTCSAVLLEAPIVDCVRVAELNEQGLKHGPGTIWELGSFDVQECRIRPVECLPSGGCSTLPQVVLATCHNFTSNGGKLEACIGDGTIYAE